MSAIKRSTIIAIPGLGSNIDDWKEIDRNNKKHTSLYDYISTNYNMIDMSLNLESFRKDIDEIIEYINEKIPYNSYIVSSSFGSVIGLIYVSKYPKKIKGVIMIDPTTIKDLHRLKSIDDQCIKDNLVNMVKLQQEIKYLNDIPIISHVNLSLKPIIKNSLHMQTMLEDLNIHMMHLKTLSTEIRSSVIVYTNAHHNIHHYTPENLFISIDNLCK